MSFKIKTQSFEGPLELLLELIEKKKLFINDISLAKVTDDFIEHIKQFTDIPMNESAHFILIASTLLLIKSKSLLPELNLTDEEESNIKDLETRLKIYKTIKEASVKINQIFGAHMIFEQSQMRKTEPIFTPDPEFTLNKALLLLKDLINRLPKNEKIPHKVIEKVMSLEEMINTLSSRITSHIRMSFKEFTKENRENRVHVIVSFLAMLELVKNGILHVQQEQTYGDIHMETKDVGVPRY